MAHFAVICPESPGHFNPMTTLIAALKTEGHQVTWIGTLDGAARAKRLNIDSIAVGQSEYPIGSLNSILKQLGQLSGWRAARFSLNAYLSAMEVLQRDCPQAIRDSGATALITDETVFASRNLADVVGLPWISVSNAFCLHPDADHPPLLPAWKYRKTRVARIRNSLGRSLGGLMMRSMQKQIFDFRRRHNLPAYDFFHQNVSERATIVQCPIEFDYPRSNPPAWLHYVGALHQTSSRPSVGFSYERLDGRPLIYASLGTAQNRLYSLFQTIAAAADDPSYQLVISLGGGGTPEDLGPLPGNPIVVPFAPQLELIRRASLVITHAGMNTAMESIAQGKPMVAIPITNDQPAVAARIAWTGCGEVVPIRQVNRQRLTRAIHRVLQEERYRQNSLRLSAANRRAGGVSVATKKIARSLS